MTRLDRGCCYGSVLTGSWPTCARLPGSPKPSTPLSRVCAATSRFYRVAAADKEGPLAGPELDIVGLKRLNQEVVRAMNLPETKERLFSVGEEIIASSPEEFAATIKNDMVRLGKLVKDAGIKAE